MSNVKIVPLDRTTFIRARKERFRTSERERERERERVRETQRERGRERFRERLKTQQRNGANIDSIT